MKRRWMSKIIKCWTIVTVFLFCHEISALGCMAPGPFIEETAIVSISENNENFEAGTNVLCGWSIKFRGPECDMFSVDYTLFPVHNTTKSSYCSIGKNIILCVCYESYCNQPNKALSRVLFDELAKQSWDQNLLGLRSAVNSRDKWIQRLRCALNKVMEANGISLWKFQFPEVDDIRENPNLLDEFNNKTNWFPPVAITSTELTTTSTTNTSEFFSKSEQDPPENENHNESITKNRIVVRYNDVLIIMGSLAIMMILWFCCLAYSICKKPGMKREKANLETDVESNAKEKEGGSAERHIGKKRELDPQTLLMDVDKNKPYCVEEILGEDGTPYYVKVEVPNV